MKIVNFTINKDHTKSFGIYQKEGIVDVGSHSGCRDINEFMARHSLEELQRYVESPADLQLNDISFLPVIDRPGKIFGVGMNYAEKRKEFNETSDAPTLFVRFADSQVGHNGTIIKPASSEQFDYEGELAIIIGRTGRNISAENALDFVAGYSCYMDGSVRDWQHKWYTAGKNWPSTGAFGPWMVTPDEVGDPQNLSIKTWLNDRLVQDDTTANMVHTIPQMIAYISTFTQLSPGDVIMTGSPGGVGKTRVPPLFLHENDKIEVEIENIGRLTNLIQNAPLSEFTHSKTAA
ncbi:fumarylacetoacetate hydrolase family protein [Rahnella aceris]|uniref:fumarylacetoacetate hydrolase family protein n=1 Tax=Rahnella sp. (strain Y9602) TaxID=2703885 RepID=UPI000EAEDA67|nr:fumarylacetoacetate hydrolase family protein [Rahnella aceris]MBU9864217.1 fumarylacetoacetate hydrolase family protein [Rahnella aceris]RKT75292.1 2-keto-4-pentenoate hydratase/2-oxohepta-3-ene-1,7-dioic acid hydratase in catechol pathway [Rahnella aquatilis]